MSAGEFQLISTFSGAGGLDYGFHRSGFRTVFACDISPACVETFNTNFPNRPARALDLAAITPAELLEHLPIGRRRDGLVGLIGGPPCQGFSRGNVRRDPSDPRNTLPLRFTEMLRELNRAVRIDFFVFENVIGLRGPMYQTLLDTVRADMRKAGFQLFQDVLDASDFGVPQRRQRMFIIGLSTSSLPGRVFRFPKPRPRLTTVRDAIAGLPRPTFYDRGLVGVAVPFHPNHWTSQPKSMKFQTGLVTDGRSFRRLEWDAPSPTIAYGNREISLHPDGDRRLSILEAMLLQGFPKRFRLRGNFSQQVEQVSNAVPPPLARAIATQIRKSLLAPTPAR
jgi:DNA (cytosine-5)-methyltransferase 1